MTLTLLWDDGPGEVRTGLVEDGQLVELRLIRPRHPERADMAYGEYYTARMGKKIMPEVALCNLGFGDDVALRPAPKIPQGALTPVKMIRGPIPEPGRWKNAVVMPCEDLEPRSEAGWHFSGEPWERALSEAATYVDEIVCSSESGAASVRRHLGENAPLIRTYAQAFEAADFDGWLDLVLEASFPIENGELSIERTRAMTMIDVNGTGPALDLDRAAAVEIPLLLRLYDITGPVGIDFVTLKNRADRLKVDAVLAEACVPLGFNERTAINGYGFCQLVRPRKGPSVPEILCGTTPGRLSVESKAVALLREAGRSVGIGPRQLVAPLAVADYINDRSHELLALRSFLGAEVTLVADASATGHGYVHVAQS
jgi:ribonuclease G